MMDYSDNNVYMDAVALAAAAVRRHCGTAEIGIVLGSGLGDFANQLEDGIALDYADIPSFPRSTVPGHAGKWWSGILGGKRVYLLQGRIHSYEGYSQREITMYVRMMKLLDVHTLILTNAAGCVNTSWQPGDLMVMTDFINYSGLNPLTGPNLDFFGPRFPDMSHVCDPDLIKISVNEAEKHGLPIPRQGVYMWFNGPCFETPAEIRMARILGADAVGMSTVPEAIVARHCGIRVLGISCLTNMAAGILDQPLSHEEVTETANRVRDTFTSLLLHTAEALHR